MAPLPTGLFSTHRHKALYERHYVIAAQRRGILLCRQETRYLCIHARTRLLVSDYLEAAWHLRVKIEEI